MNHKPWLLVVEASLSWFPHYLHTKNPKELRNQVTFTFVSLTLNRTPAVSSNKFPKWLALKEAKPRGSEKPAIQVSTRYLATSAGADPCQLPCSEGSLEINEVTLGFYFTAWVAPSLETMVTPKAGTPAFFLTIPSSASLVGNWALSLPLVWRGNCPWNASQCP